MFGSSVTIQSTFYFYFISRYWVWFQIFGWTMNLIVVVAVIFMPESPKYLLTNKKYNECRAVLSKMGKFNNIKNSKPFEGKFDREI